MVVQSIAFFVAAALAIALPMHFPETLAIALGKLALDPTTALVIVGTIAAGAWFDVPLPRSTRRLNLGGFIAGLLALYEAALLIQHGYGLGGFVATVVLTVLICHRAARPDPRSGIRIPSFLPALIATVSAAVGAPALATPIALVAGVVGPLVASISARDATIGGAGTLHCIALSIVVACYVA
jgi:Protein of unknown function (DUF1614)